MQKIRAIGLFRWDVLGGYDLSSSHPWEQFVEQTWQEDGVAPDVSSSASFGVLYTR